MGEIDRAGPQLIWYAFDAADEGPADLPKDREPSGYLQFLLGHTKMGSTVRYLDVELEDALAIAEAVEI